MPIKVAEDEAVEGVVVTEVMQAEAEVVMPRALIIKTKVTLTDKGNRPARMM